MKDSIKVSADELTQKLGKIEVKVKGKRNVYRYYDRRNTKRYVDSYLPPDEFLKIMNLPKTALR